MRMNARFCCGHKNPMFSAVISHYQNFFILLLISSGQQWADQQSSQNIRRTFFGKTQDFYFFFGFWLEIKMFCFLNIRNFLKVGFFFSFCFLFFAFFLSSYIRKFCFLKYKEVSSEFEFPEI